MTGIAMKYRRIGRKHAFYSDDLPGFMVIDNDKMMAFYRVSGELEEFLAKQDKRTYKATPSRTFNEVFGR